MFDGRERRGARATIVTGDQHDVRVRLCHACRDRAHADFADQLHTDARARLVFFVVDQLRQVFNRVNVMMRRR